MFDFRKEIKMKAYLMTGVLIPLFFVGMVFGQSEASKSDGQSTADIEEGERLTLELVSMRQGLPTRWAAIIKYQAESTPDAETYQLIKGVSYVAEDRTQKIKVQRRKETDVAIEGNFPMDRYNWSSDSEQMVRIINKWLLQRTQIPVKDQFIDPYMLGLSSAYTLSLGMRPDFVETHFFSEGLFCVGSTEIPNGRKVVWAVERPSNKTEKVRAVFTIVFEDGLPVDYETRFYPKWEPNNPKFPSRLANKTSTTWKRIEDLKISVPVEVLGNWSEYEGEEGSLDVQMTVSWLFGDDVPDDAFSDPRVKPPIIPKFPNPDK
jgi:hypothetical protein